MTDKKKTIHRVEKNRNYSVIHNHGPHDERLTWGARGLLTYMLTKPDDFAFYNEELAKHSPESVGKIKSLIRELKGFGYIKRIPVKDPDTKRVKKWETVLYEVPLEPDQEQEGEDDPGDEKPEGGNCASGSNVDNTPEEQKPEGGKPGGVESHTVEIVPLLNTDSIPNTDKTIIPVREQQAAPDDPKGGGEVEIDPHVPDMQKATAIFFLKTTGKAKLSDDDKICLKLLFKIHTPAAIQSEILKSLERLKKNGFVKVMHIDEKEYTIQKAEKLPVRYIYNCMKNWSSLRGTGKGGQKGGQTRGNPERAAKDYTGKAASGFFVE